MDAFIYSLVLVPALRELLPKSGIEAIQRYGSLGVPVAITAVVFVIGLLVLPAAKETRGEPLPA